MNVTTRVRPISGVLTHAREAAERDLGMAPTPEQWHAARNDILQGRASLVRRERVNAGEKPFEVWLVSLCGMAVTVGWNPEERVIITVLKNGHRAPRQPREERRRA